IHCFAGPVSKTGSIDIQRLPHDCIGVYQPELWHSAIETDVPIVTHNKVLARRHGNWTETVHFWPKRCRVQVLNIRLTHQSAVDHNLSLAPLYNIATDSHHSLHSLIIAFADYHRIVASDWWESVAMLSRGASDKLWSTADW